MEVAGGTGRRGFVIINGVIKTEVWVVKVWCKR